MFAFQRFEIYKKAKVFHIACVHLCRDHSFDYFVINQLRRASFSAPLNIAEGLGKFSVRDRKNYFTIARASVFECMAILDIQCDEGGITPQEFEKLTQQAAVLSRMLYSMIKKENDD